MNDDEFYKALDTLAKTGKLPEPKQEKPAETKVKTETPAKTDWSEPRFGFYGGLAGLLSYGIPGWIGFGLLGKIIDQGITSMREEYQQRKENSILNEPIVKRFYDEHNFATSPLQLIAGTCWNHKWLSDYKTPSKTPILYNPKTEMDPDLKAYQDWSKRWDAAVKAAAA